MFERGFHVYDMAFIVFRSRGEGDRIYALLVDADDLPELIFHTAEGGRRDILLGFLARNPRNKERYMLACYTGNKSTLIAMEGERPTLINGFATDEIHNQLFYLLSIWNELHLEQEDDTLVLCGDNTADKLHGEAKNFIRNIERINARELFMPNLLNKIENTPFDLQALILCE